MARRFEATLEERRKYAVIDFDIFPYGYELTRKGMERMGAIWPAYRARLKRAGVPSRGVTFIRGKSSGMARVLKEDAQKIKEQIDTILNSPVCVHRAKVEDLP